MATEAAGSGRFSPSTMRGDVHRQQRRPSTHGPIQLVDKNFNRLDEPHRRAIVRHIAGHKGNSMMLPMLIEELQLAAVGGNKGGGGNSGGLSAADRAWLCSLLSGEGLGASEKVAAARDKFFAAVGVALGFHRYHFKKKCT